jgi:adenylosuccinate lyase
VSSISPIDGRYKKTVSELDAFFSEQALMRYRVLVEIKYLIALLNHKSFQAVKPLRKKDLIFLCGLYEGFSPRDFNQIKRIESKTKHDVNAVVEFISQKLTSIGRPDLCPLVHFGLTSEDINNISYSLMTKDATKKIMLPNIKIVVKALKRLAKKTSGMALLSLTHGQPATTTTLGKELAVFISRSEKQIVHIQKVSFLAKLSGATGTYAAHSIAFPKFSWSAFAKKFIKSLGLEQNPITTQVEPGDSLAELFHSYVRLNNVLMDFSVDMWLYISRNIFLQKNNVGEVGSSTMPHKINPIFFENAEGNLDVANNNFTFLASRITKSRMQRDLSGSTVFRNIGVGFAHSLISYKNLVNGISRLDPNKKRAEEELEKNWNILAEAVQTVLRKSGDASAYIRIKKLTRGRHLNQKTYIKMVNELDLDKKEKALLLSLTPSSYLGEVAKILEDL